MFLVVITLATLSLEMTHMIQVNEGVKYVVRAAQTINLMALNAILTARRLGKAARGFAVLSRELCHFADELSRQMARVHRLTADAVAATSSLIGAVRRAATFERALQGELPSRARRGLQTVIDRHADRMAHGVEQLALTRARMEQALLRAARLVRLGRGLSMNARVEAAHGGAHREVLAQVAGDFDRSVEDIWGSLAAVLPPVVMDAEASA